MTDTVKIAMVKTLVENDEAATDAVVSVYLERQERLFCVACIRGVNGPTKRQFR